MKNSAGISIKKNKKIIVINTNKISPRSCNTNFYWPYSLNFYITLFAVSYKLWILKVMLNLYYIYHKLIIS